jgi:outer membrane protein OmpA-like peptidoglycan-associated protein
MKRTLLVAALALSIAVPGYCGWLDETMRNVGESLGNRAAHEAADSAYEGAKKGTRDAVKDAVSDDYDKPRTGTKKSAKDKAQSSADSSASLEESESINSRFDFIPGDKVIFQDDFSDTDLGEFPRKWHLKGPMNKGYNNAVEVVDFQGKRMLRVQPAVGDDGQNKATQYIRLNVKGDLPEKFTIEFDAYFIKPLGGGYDTYYNLYLLKSGSAEPGKAFPTEGAFFFSGKDAVSKNTTTKFNKTDNKLHHIAVSVNGTFVKAYVDNIRVINDPDGAARPITLIGICMGVEGNMASDRVMFTNFRLAEGGKDLKSALDSDGKIVTHGILFDTGKDVIKPESLPTLKKILGLLNDDPELRFSVEGHTDNQGSKGLNQPLSEKRAAAVNKWLMGKGIESGRLKSKGFGDSKPLDSNKTPEGRANNRRVEFVKY